MSKKLFDDAIGEVPASTVDVEAAITRGRRADRLRRVGSPVLATVVAVGVLLGGMTVMLRPDDDADNYVQAQPTTATSPTPSVDGCEGTTPTAPPQPEKPAATEARLTTALTDLVSSTLPEGATLEQSPVDKDGRPDGPLVFEHRYSEPKQYENGCQVGEDAYHASASVRWSGGTAGITMSIGRAGGWNVSADSVQLCRDPGTESKPACHTETTPNGDLIKIVSLADATNQLVVVRPDQTAIVIEVYPESPDASRLPLTHEQLKEIALDPRVTMYPK
jgi:hypothetical protein